MTAPSSVSAGSAGSIRKCSRNPRRTDDPGGGVSSGFTPSKLRLDPVERHGAAPGGEGCARNARPFPEQVLPVLEEAEDERRPARSEEHARLEELRGDGPRAEWGEDLPGDEVVGSTAADAL